MLSAKPDHIAVWTDAGRDDNVAQVHIAPIDTDGLHLSVESESPITYIALRWNIPLPQPARLLGDEWERGYGALEWHGIVPERVLPWYTLIHNPQSGDTEGYGVETGAGSLASWRMDEGGVTLVLDVQSGAMGVHLGSRILPAATVRVLKSHAGESPFAFATRFCRRLCPAPRLPELPVYGGNDWYYRYGNITDQTVRHDAGIIRALSPSRTNDPTYVIDAGWFPNRGCNGGGYDRGNAAFPDMPALAEWMRCQHIRPGIWIRPLLSGDAVPDSWRVPENHPLHSQSGFTLDPTVPDVLQQVQNDIRRLADWGYRVIKHDFTTFDITGRWGFEMSGSLTAGSWHFADRRYTNAEIIRTLYGAIRDAAGDATLIGCNTVGHLGAGLFELQRTGDDTSGKHWERTRKMGVNTLAFRMPQHNTLFAVDADCVGLTDAVPWQYNRQWLDIVARSGTPLFVSADPDSLGAEQKAALTDAFARAATVQLSAEPLDWMETTAPMRWRTDSGIVAYNWNDFIGTIFPCPG